jgi:hypothetical protein
MWAPVSTLAEGVRLATQTSLGSATPSGSVPSGAGETCFIRRKLASDTGNIPCGTSPFRPTRELAEDAGQPAGLRPEGTDES